VSRPVDPFVRVPRRFYNARRCGDISAGAFEAGCWIAGRADYRTGYHYATIEELLRELGRQHKESRELRRQIQEELHPDWLDFDVSRGQRKPWVFRLTGLQLGHDLDKSDADSVQVTWTPTSPKANAAPHEATDPPGQRPGHEPGLKKKKEKSLGRAVGSKTTRAGEGSEERHVPEDEELEPLTDEQRAEFERLKAKTLKEIPF
jgi:hypothetical protein